MVSSLLADALANPTAALLELYDPGEPLDDFPAKVSNHFSNVFGSQQKLEEIPLLGRSNPPESHKDGALVRFNAMIQDTSPSPEMYLARRTANKCGGWGLGADETNTDQAISYGDLRECAVVWATSIPGETSWCNLALKDLLPESSTVPKVTHAEKYPIPEAPHVGVQVKIYENRRNTDPYKATDLVNFVGILTFEQFYGDLESDSPSIVPTVHVLFSRALPPTIVPQEFPLAASIDVEKTRNDLIAWIADEALGGDRNAAELALLCAIARVHARTPPILPPTLTITHFPSSEQEGNSRKPTPPALSFILGQLLPMVVHIPLSLETLNKTNFSPRSETEDLHSGWLQLPAGSIALITEGGVTEGNISERGVSNLQAVQETMTGQTLDYVFPFSRFSFQTDISFLVLTEGRKSTFFKTTITCPLEMKIEEFDFYKPDEIVKLPPQNDLELFRALVGGAKVGEVRVDDQTAEFIQTDFVNERKSSAGSQAVTSDDLIQTMIIARLIALSYHKPTITVDIWEKAKALESQRKSRSS